MTDMVDFHLSFLLPHKLFASPLGLQETFREASIDAGAIKWSAYRSAPA